MTQPYRKDDTWGSQQYTDCDANGSCPPGQVPTQVANLYGGEDCLCEAGETSDLSGQPLTPQAAAPATTAAVTPSLGGITDFLNQYGFVGYIVAGVLLGRLLFRP